MVTPKVSCLICHEQHMTKTAISFLVSVKKFNPCIPPSIDLSFDLIRSRVRGGSVYLTGGR